MKRYCGLAGALVFGCITTLLGTEAAAQSYPAKPVRVLIASSAGSNPDTVTRVIAGDLSRVWGQQVVVDNRAGAGGNIGAEIAARAPVVGWNDGARQNASVHRRRRSQSNRYGSRKRRVEEAHEQHGLHRRGQWSRGARRTYPH